MVPFRRIEAPDTNSTRLATQCEGVSVQNLADASVKDGCFLGSGHPALKEKQTYPDCHQQGNASEIGATKSETAQVSIHATVIARLVISLQVASAIKTWTKEV